jgi:DNA-binding response OmpR family regulator
MKGRSLVKRLKASRKSPPVALITDYDNQEDVREDRKPLVDLVISKPIDMDQALGRIAEILKSTR